MATDKDQLDGDAGARIDQAGRQVSFTVLASVLAMALRYVAALITTRILGIALFGSYVQAQTVTQLLSMTATLGLVPGVVPFVARARLADDPAGLRAVVRATWAITLIASSLTAAALFFLAPWLAESAYRDPALEQILRWLAPLVAFSAIMLGSLAIAQGFKAMRVHALIEKVVTVVATLTGLLVTWWFELGLPGVLVATLLGPAAGLLCSVGFLRARVPGVLSAGSPAAPWPVGSLLRTCWPLLGSGLIAFALTSVNVVLLGVLDDPGEVGKYGAAVRMLPVVFVVHQSAAQLFYAHASERYAAGDIAGVNALYKRTARWSIWSSTGTALLLIVWGREILGLFGPEFAAGGPALAMLALGHAATAMTGACGKALIAMGRIRQNMINVVSMLGINTALSLLWIPEHGAYGAACATMTSLAVVRIAQAAQIWWSFRIHPWSPDSLVALLAGGVVYVFAQPLRDSLGGALGWFAAMATFGLAWLALYAAFGLGPEDRASLRRLLGQRR